MDLTGAPLLITTATLAVALPGLALWLWPKVHGPRALRVAQRLGMIVAAQVAAVLVAGVLVNDQFAFYESWSDLFDSGTAAPPGPQPGPPKVDPSGQTPTPGTPTPTPSASSSAFGPLPGDGRVRREMITGPSSRVSADVWILLPAGYDDPANASTRYPVVEFLPGFPGTPTTWLHALDLQTVMDAEVSAGRVRPFIGVLPTMNVAGRRDTECVDIPGGPQVDTWLSKDVPQLVLDQTRALPLGAHWAVTGYSTGGFCAAKLAVTHPQVFGNAAVLSGYFSPSSATGDLFGGSIDRQHANDPLWLIRHQPPPTARLLLVYSEQDPETAVPSKQFQAAVRPPLTVDVIALPKGGHNTGVWLGVEPAGLRGLDAHLN